MIVVLWLLSFNGDDCQFVTIASKASRAVDMAEIAASKPSTALNRGANTSWIQCVGCCIMVADVGCWFIWGVSSIGAGCQRIGGGCHHCGICLCGVISMAGGEGSASGVRETLGSMIARWVVFVVSLSLVIVVVVVIVISVALVLQG